MKTFSLRLSALFTLAILLTGCQPAQPTQVHSPYISNQAQPDLTPDQLTNSDPCSVRLHDMAGLLLAYYQKHNELPQDLDQLQSVAEPGDNLDFTCPDTHQPYTYLPTGIRSPGQSRQIIVCDSAPHTNGFRYCIFLSPKYLHPGSSLIMDVQLLPEATFQTFQAGN